MPALDDNRNPQLAGRGRAPDDEKKPSACWCGLTLGRTSWEGELPVESGVSSPRQRTTTVSSIHGWIAQMNRCVPGVRVLGSIVIWPPAGMKLVG